MTYDAMKARLSVAPQTNSDYFKIFTKTVYGSSFSSSPSYTEVYINNSPALTGVQIVDDSDVREQKKILSVDTPLNNGDVYKWNDEYWINTLTDNMNGIYYRGTIRKCPSSLKWLDSDGIEHEAYFTFKSDVATNFGIQDGRLVSLGNERRTVLISANIDTLKIGKNKRFVFDGRGWRVSAVDTLSIDGIVQITLDEDEIDISKDNVELKIADYYGNVASYSLTILNGSSFSIHAGTTIQLNTEVRNNGVIVDKPVSYCSSDETIATVDDNGLVTTYANGNVVISATLVDDSSVNDSISGTVQFEVVNNYQIELDQPLSVLKGTSKTFTAIIKNNGIVDTNKFVQWYLYSDDKTSPVTNASMPFNSTTQATINATGTGYMQLKAVMIGTPSVYQWFRIQIKSLI